MADRLKDKVAIVTGAGAIGAGWGNGKATAVLYAREGAKVLCADINPDAAQETADIIKDEGGEADVFAVDVTDSARVEDMVEAACAAFGRLDILHNNVGISVEGGDAPVTEITTEAFDKIVQVNLRSMVYACKHALPVMREQRRGAIINISSMAAISSYPWVGYKATKTAMVELTRQIAFQNAEYGIRANVILPGLMDTPMAVDTRAREWGKTRQEIVDMRDAQVPLGGKMGTGWDVAYAALFLASEEAKFITGVTLPVDGGANIWVR